MGDLLYGSYDIGGLESYSLGDIADTTDVKDGARGPRKPDNFLPAWRVRIDGRIRADEHTTVFAETAAKAAEALVEQNKAAGREFVYSVVDATHVRFTLRYPSIDREISGAIVRVRPDAASSEERRRRKNEQRKLYRSPEWKKRNKPRRGSHQGAAHG